jgi:hypothetical protein
MERLILIIVFSFAVSALATPSGPFVIDQTERTSSICELHHVRMSRVRVPLYASGIASLPHDHSRCPHGRRPIDTGCTKFGEDAYGYIWVCPECAKACK